MSVHTKYCRADLCALIDVFMGVENMCDDKLFDCARTGWGHNDAMLHWPLVGRVRVCTAQMVIARKHDHYIAPHFAYRLWVCMCNVGNN